MTIAPLQPCRETAAELGCAEVIRSRLLPALLLTLLPALLLLLLLLLLTLLLPLRLTLRLARRATDALLVLDDAALRLLPQDQHHVDCVMYYALHCALCILLLRAVLQRAVR